MTRPGLEGARHISLVTECDREENEMNNDNSNVNIAVAVAAGAATLIVTRFVWKRIKNRKAQN